MDIYGNTSDRTEKQSIHLIKQKKQNGKNKIINIKQHKKSRAIEKTSEAIEKRSKKQKKRST